MVVWKNCCIFAVEIRKNMKQSKRHIRYKMNKLAKVSDFIICPICGCTFAKKQYAQAFCSRECKDKFWNDKGDRHDKGYYRRYNQLHPERYEGLLGLGFTERERDENFALYQYCTDEDFRKYVDEPCIGDEAESFGCDVSLYQQWLNYNGL